MTAYYWMLGVAAIISSLSQFTSNRGLKRAIEEMRAEMKDHRERLGRLEARPPVGFRVEGSP